MISFNPLCVWFSIPKRESSPAKSKVAKKSCEQVLKKIVKNIWQIRLVVMRTRIFHLPFSERWDARHQLVLRNRRPENEVGSSSSPPGPDRPPENGEKIKFCLILNNWANPISCCWSQDFFGRLSSFYRQVASDFLTFSSCRNRKLSEVLHTFQGKNV